MIPSVDDLKWPHVQVRRIARVESGFGFPREEQGLEGEEYPFFKVSDMNLAGNEVEMRCSNNTVSEATITKLGAKPFPAGTVIFPKIGAAIATEKKRLLAGPATYDNNVIGIIEAKFLYYWLQTVKLNEISNKGPVPSIRKSAIEDLLCPLPALSEQRRIVEILDQADRLRRLRAEADAKADRILSALFIKMFGDPATNPKRWPRKRLGDLLKQIDSGWSPVCENREAAPDEWGVLKLGAVTRHRYVESENKALPSTFDPRPELEVRPGDLLFTRKNTRQLVGACAYVDRTRPRLMLSDLVFRLRLKTDAEMDPLYVWALLTSRSKRSSIQMLAGGSAGSMPNISKGRLEALEVEKPPHGLQARFAGAVADVDSVRRRTREAQNRIEKSFAVLLCQAFNGELTRSWREAHMTELLQEMEQQAKALAQSATEGGPI